MPVSAIPLASIVAIVVGCSSGALSSPTLPPLPAAPPGWTALAAFGSATGDRGGVEASVHQGPVAIRASCMGVGTLFVVASLTWPGGDPASGDTAIFPCSVGGGPARIELVDIPVGNVTFSAFIEETAAAVARSSFAVSIEQQ